MTYRADPALDARLAALVDGLPSHAAPPLGDVGALRPYRTPRWVLVLVAVVLLVAAILAFLLVGGRSADGYTVSVPAGLHPRMTAAQVATQGTGMLHDGAALWPSDEPVPAVDILSVAAGGGGGPITWTVNACGSFVGRGPPSRSAPPHSSSGYFVIDDATGGAFSVGFPIAATCPR